MAQIVFLCPPANSITGGIKYIFRMAETLCDLGYDAVVLEQQLRRPSWFASSVSVVGPSVLQPNPSQILVIPEDQKHLLPTLKNWPQEKVVYNQNHFYGAFSDTSEYNEFGVKNVLCTSRAIDDYVQLRHPGVVAHLIPYSIDRSLFRPLAKLDRVAFMPRKRRIEAAYIRDLFRFQHPQFRHWEWRELSNLSEMDVARGIGESKVFLSLSRLEGFGLTPLEAMACDCVVAGFTGIGGREYATAANGFWAAEDDFPACLEQIKAAIDLADQENARRQAHRAACEKTLSNFTPETFQLAVKMAWERILT